MTGGIVEGIHATGGFVEGIAQETPAIVTSETSLFPSSYCSFKEEQLVRFGSFPVHCMLLR